MLEAAGSRRLLLVPSRSSAPFKYQEKRMSGVWLRPLLQLSVTACPSTTSAAGLMRRRAASRRGRQRASAPLHICSSGPPTTGSPPAFCFSRTLVGSVWASRHRLCESLDNQEALALNDHSDLLIVTGCSMVEDSELEPTLMSKAWLDQLAMDSE